MKLQGTVEVKGKPITWQCNPSTGGFILCFGGCETIHLEVEPTPEVAGAAMTAYEQGKRYGNEIGRAVLQNEFRNLMACQPR